MRKPFYITAAELSARGTLPDEMRGSARLVYNSPAALDFNSPGAQGFGVKRAALAIPESVMLLISPACCGRNTAALTDFAGGAGYGERFAYLLLDENDIVTGKHLARIPEAVRALVESRERRPSCVILCLTCVDALLGTDMERVARRASEAAGLKVLPAYMYALTRESTRPPMVAVRETVYSLLEPRRREATSCNLLGFFSPVASSDLRAFLAGCSLKNVRELARAKSFEEYQKLAAANFNLVLNSEAVDAAESLQKRLGIPYLALRRVYELDKIEGQYRSLSRLLGAAPDLGAYQESAEEAIARFCSEHTDAVLGVGSGFSAEPLELALALLRYGLRVEEIYLTGGTPEPFYIKKIAQLSPATRLYSNLSLSMLCYREEESAVTLAIGRDAACYHPHAAHVLAGFEEPFGYEAIAGLFTRMREALS